MALIPFCNIQPHDTNIVRFAHEGLTALFLVARVQTSQGVTHPRIAAALARLTVEFLCAPQPCKPKTPW